MGDFPLFFSTYQCFKFASCLVEEGHRSGCLVVWQPTKLTLLIFKKGFFIDLISVFYDKQEDFLGFDNNAEIVFISA